MSNEQTTAERAGLQRCPKCERRSLRVTKLCNGSTKHECVFDCAYLMVWKRTEVPLVNLIPTGQV